MELYRRRTKRLGILWVVSYVAASTVFIFYNLRYPPRADVESAQAFLSQVLTLPRILSVLSVVLFFYPLLFAIRYNAKRAGMTTVSWITLAGILMFSMMLFILAVIAGIVIFQFLS